MSETLESYVRMAIKMYPHKYGEELASEILGLLRRKGFNIDLPNSNFVPQKSVQNGCGKEDDVGYSPPLICGEGWLCPECEKLEKSEDEISLCGGCHCMTKTIKGVCGKCGFTTRFLEPEKSEGEKKP